MHRTSALIALGLLLALALVAGCAPASSPTATPTPPGDGGPGPLTTQTPGAYPGMGTPGAGTQGYPGPGTPGAGPGVPVQTVMAPAATPGARASQS